MSADARHVHGPRAPLRPLERVGAVAGYFLIVYRRTWQGSLFSRFASPLLFLLAMGLGLGSLVNASSGGVDGVPYLEFVAPGMVAVQAMMVAVSESTYPVYGLFTWNRMYHSMLATPLTVTDLLLGHLTVVAAQGGIATIAFVLVAALFGGFSSWWVLLAVPVGVLVTLAFAVPIFGFSARAKGDGAFNVVYRLVITPLMLFSGVFFPIDRLPGWFEPVAWVTPLWHGVELVRGSAHASLAPFDLVHLAVLLLFIGLGWVYAHRGMTRKLVP
ncbi:ABC transporter permease [Janibacter corallicola]|uniref:ABC transporter permease n=1 Tax=Janibacter corallicola TaxID=415212 RepID=UPI0008349BB1|nr:ABC transporter permease [Janibacter corallicola]